LLFSACSKKQEKDAVKSITLEENDVSVQDDGAQGDLAEGNGTYDGSDDTAEGDSTYDDPDDIAEGDTYDDSDDIAEGDTYDGSDDIAEGDTYDGSDNTSEGDSTYDGSDDIAEGDTYDGSDDITENSLNQNDEINLDTTPSDKPKEDIQEESDTDSQSTSKKIIAIDAGHQSKGNSDKEPIGPGATTTKAKVSSGTSGVATGVAEYKLNLAISLKLKQELLDRGYEVYMIRETNDVDISNKERADMANQSGADIFLRIHADGSDNQDVNGASTLYPSRDNLYVDYLSDSSIALSKAVIDGICEDTGAKNRGAIARDDMSGINWCTIPVTIVEMGYMSNPKEDELMQTDDYQNKIVIGICDGIEEYYKNLESD